MTQQEALQRTIEHREIFHDEMVELMRQVMRGEVSPTITGAPMMLRLIARPVEVADRTPVGAPLRRELLILAMPKARAWEALLQWVKGSRLGGAPTMGQGLAPGRRSYKRARGMS